MRCSDALEAVLTAEISALRHPDGPLASHLATCGDCRQAVERILAGHAALQAMAGRPSRTTAHTAAERAVVRGRAAVRVRRARRLVPALLTAAAIAIVLLMPRDDVPSGNAPNPRAVDVLPPIVEGGANDVAVIVTGRPDVTVVWEF